MTSTSTISSPDLTASLDLVEVKPGLKFSRAALRDILPDVKTALFFGKVYGLDAQQLGNLLHTVLNTDLSAALFAEGGTHSQELQDYLLDGYYDDEGAWHDGIWQAMPVHAGDLVFDPTVPKGEILPEVWASLEVEVADSIKQVAAKLGDVVGRLPGKQGEMVFRSMAVMNAKRPTIGDYRARIQHARQQENLLILDVSGSMTAATVKRIIDDVVALAYTANAHLAIVSNTCTYWTPGTYSTDAVLAAAEYSGTHYEQLVPLFDRDWGVVVTVADYDSSLAAKQKLARCTGRIDTVLDVSLTCRPTFLAECVGQLASEVKPLLTAAVPTEQHVLRN